jgi:hypothetical protein
MTSEDPRQRLGRLVRTRRKELKLTQAEIQEADGPSPATQRLIEKGEHGELRKSTIEPLERALRWEPGSIEAVLAGGSPIYEIHVDDEIRKTLHIRPGKLTSGGLPKPPTTYSPVAAKAADGGETFPITGIGTPPVAGTAPDDSPYLHELPGNAAVNLAELTHAEIVELVKSGHDIGLQVIELMDDRFPAGEATEPEKERFREIRDETLHAQRLLSPMLNIPEVQTRYVVHLLAALIMTIALKENIEERSASRSAASDLTPNDAPPDLAEAACTAPPGYVSPGRAARDAQDQAGEENRDRDGAGGEPRARIDPEQGRLVILMLNGADKGKIRLIDRHEFETMPRDVQYDILYAVGPHVPDDAAVAGAEAVLRTKGADYLTPNDTPPGLAEAARKLKPGERRDQPEQGAAGGEENQDLGTED